MQNAIQKSIYQAHIINKVQMTQKLDMTGEITILLNNFSHNNKSQLKRKLGDLVPQNQQESVRYQVFLQKQIKIALSSIMGKGDLQSISELIELICDVSKKQNQQQHIQRPLIKQSLAISLVQNLLQCLGINDLKVILPVISEKICSFKQLLANDQNRMLRVINHLLKRISKTEDYLIRGQLQFALTKILPICHDSGFHYRIPLAKGIQIVQEEQNDQFKTFSSQSITYQFFKDFWGLQKFILDPNELSAEDFLKASATQSPKKGVNKNIKADPLISMRLKHIQRVLNDVIQYMYLNPCSQNSSILTQPIKFLTNTNLLELQLSDSFFRKIIMCQVLMFSFTLKHLKPTGNILKGVMLTETERQTINKIQNIAQKYFENIEKNKKGPIESSDKFLQNLKGYFDNELEWMDLKDNWKEKKKAFLKLDISISQQHQNDKKNSKDQINYKKKLEQVHLKIAKQMNIEGDNLLSFLRQPCVPHIVTTPTQTSFGYYWSQAKSCLDTFNFEIQQQSEFESKSQYNMFEWKAMRSLYKQNLKQICIGQKNPKLKQYKMLSFVDKKERQQKQRQIKLSASIQAGSQAKSDNILADINDKNSSIQNASKQSLIIDQNNQQQADQEPKKKVKTQ